MCGSAAGNALPKRPYHHTHTLPVTHHPHTTTSAKAGGEQAGAFTSAAHFLQRTFCTRRSHALTGAARTRLPLTVAYRCGQALKVWRLLRGSQWGGVRNICDYVAQTTPTSCTHHRTPPPCLAHVAALARCWREGAAPTTTLYGGDAGLQWRGGESGAVAASNAWRCAALTSIQEERHRPAHFGEPFYMASVTEHAAIFHAHLHTAHASAPPALPLTQRSPRCHAARSALSGDATGRASACRLPTWDTMVAPLEGRKRHALLEAVVMVSWCWAVGNTNVSTLTAHRSTTLRHLPAKIHLFHSTTVLPFRLPGVASLPGR